MNTEYRIDLVGNQFAVIAPDGERMDGYTTEDAARQEIERWKKEEAMWEGAKGLIDSAIKAHMEKYGVDRETARYWINSAAEMNE